MCVRVKIPRAFSHLIFFPFGNRYNGLWRWSAQQACYLAALVTFYDTGRLITMAELQQLIGVSLEQTNDYHIDLEDFLVGLCNVSQELVGINYLIFF